MRNLTFLAMLTTLLVASTAEARLFRQTYGATVPAPGGEGCVWNLNQDYFVPRHCDTGRYDLFSACKTGHTRSAACRNLHPIHAGYCTPYGACHYRWRDHVYKKFCGCTPHRCFRGPWRLEQCEGQCRASHEGCGPSGSSCGYEMTEAWATPGVIGVEESPYLGELPNVEPFGGERLGMIAALAGTSVGGGAAISRPSASAGGSPPPAIPGLGISTQNVGGGALPIPTGF